MAVRFFSENVFRSLSEEAKYNFRKRVHKNLHANYQEACQRFFNAIEPDSYLRPHCHGISQGAETLIAIKGLMAFFYFGDTGEIISVHLLGAGRHSGVPGVGIGVEVNPGQWHTVVSLESNSVLLEMKGGPFNPDNPKYFAPWAPEEMTKEGQVYLKKLKGCITSLVTI